MGLDAVALMLMGCEIFGLFSSADIFLMVQMTFLVQQNQLILIVLDLRGRRDTRPELDYSYHLPLRCRPRTS